MEICKLLVGAGADISAQDNVSKLEQNSQGRSHLKNFIDIDLSDFHNVFHL